MEPTVARNEAEAWRLLAEWFADDIKREFICNAIRFTREGISDFISEFRSVMLARITSHMREASVFESSTLDVANEEDGTLWANEKSSNARVMFCLFMEMECKRGNKPKTKNPPILC